MTASSFTPPGRSSYLLDGRRVNLKDLIDANLLHSDDRLIFKRPRKRDTHFAIVTEDGRLTLDDESVFTTPSRAASTAAGTPIDGWHAWLVESTSTTLDALRSQLLDAVATDAGRLDDRDDHVESDSPPRGRHDFLKDARQRAESDAPVLLTVRDLLAKWGARARGQRVSQRVEADLDNHGLITTPDFRSVTLDSKVSLVCPSVSDEEDNTAADSPVIPTFSEERDIGLTLGNLPSALGGVTSVTPQDSFEQAITAMLLNDFSQLPVLAGKHNVRGAVTWKSIAKAWHIHPNASIADAIVPAQPEAYNRELFEVLPRLIADEFVIVKDDTNSISGIVTNADVVNLYGELSMPFLLIGELDQELRQLIASRFPIDEIEPVCDPDGTRSLTSVEDLNMGDYEQILKNKNSWEKLGWRLDRVMFTSRLEELREIRNDIMHFNPDPIPPDTIQKLKHFLALIRTYRA